MQKIFEEYGGVIVTVIAVVALIGLVTVLMNSEAGGVLYDAFQNIVQTFVDKSKTLINAA